MHLAAGCAWWYAARTTGKIRVHVGPVFFTMQVLRAVLTCNRGSRSIAASPWQLPCIYVAIENPTGSRLFSITEVANLLESLDAQAILFECCAYGTNYKKRWQFARTRACLDCIGQAVLSRTLRA